MCARGGISMGYRIMVPYGGSYIYILHILYYTYTIQTQYTYYTHTIHILYTFISRYLFINSVNHVDPDLGSFNITSGIGSDCGDDESFGIVIVL